MPLRVVRLTMVAFAIPVAFQGADAKSGERSGKQVVEAKCVACHSTGANGAPKIGDRKAWAKRSSQGLSSLTEHAIKGIRDMPSHGGSPDLSDLEIGRAITYMVNQSGSNWVEPVSPAALAAKRTGEQIVQAQCRKCHEAGSGGAPRIGDRAAWIPRLRQGLDMLVRSAISGHGGMPARGGMADLTDSEIRAAVVHMFGSSAVPTAKTATPAAPSDSLHKVIEGVEIYLGVVSAESLRAQHPGTDAENSMQRRIPRGKEYYHVNVSLFDTKTKAEIRDAQVWARVANPLTSDSKKLEPMVVNNLVSYGNYFRMPGTDPHTLTVEIRRPGALRPIAVTFDYMHY